MDLRMSDLSISPWKFDMTGYGYNQVLLSWYMNKILHYGTLPEPVLDHGYYSSRLQIATPVTGWGRLALLPNELITLVLEQSTLGTLQSIILVNRGALMFMLALPGFYRVLATLLGYIDAKIFQEYPSWKPDFIRRIKSETYAYLSVLTRAPHAWLRSLPWSFT
ncbi:hypothetical protein CIB48_g10792 [Xylaria polymorpha]|nr:hypothetical protein CIB48_g10792 [Xylaria polymorpha]